jgi:hypothetical protein
MQVYAKIPSALIFNHPLDGSQGPQTYKILCAHTFEPGVDALIVPKLMIKLNFVCPDFVVYDSPVFPLPIALNRADTQFDMHAAQIAHIIKRCRGITTPCMQVPITEP